MYEKYFLASKNEQRKKERQTFFSKVKYKMFIYWLQLKLTHMKKLKGCWKLFFPLAMSLVKYQCLGKERNKTLFEEEY